MGFFWLGFGTGIMVGGFLATVVIRGHSSLALRFCKLRWLPMRWRRRVLRWHVRGTLRRLREVEQ